MSPNEAATLAIDYAATAAHQVATRPFVANVNAQLAVAYATLAVYLKPVR